MTQVTYDYLSPDIVSRLTKLDLIARFVVEGFITGLHKSPYHGFSAEFAEHRQYMPGDSLRFVDWKVFGRSDRLYIKRFEDETNLKSHILLDISGSMGFSDRGIVTKFRYGCILAAALTFLMTKQRDSVGLVTFSDTIKSFVPPRSVKSQLNEIIKVLLASSPDGKTAAGNIFHTLAEQIPVRGLVIILSDLFVEPEEFIHGLKHFRHNGHEVIVFHILDPMELIFDYHHDVRFTDMESGLSLTTQPDHLRDTYHTLISDRIKFLVHAMHNISVDYAQLTTNIPFDRGLSEYLAKRKKLY